MPCCSVSGRHGLQGGIEGKGKSVAEAKTKPTEASVEDFIAKVEPQRKQDEARVLLEMFERVTGESPRLWGPSIIGFGEYKKMSFYCVIKRSLLKFI